MYRIPYYHGWLPLSKCQAHLEKDGDFLLRREFYGRKEYFVISVLTNHVIYSYCLDHDRENYKWFRLLASHKKSKDLGELITDLVDEEAPLDVRHGTVLTRAIPSIRTKIISHTYERISDDPLMNPYDHHSGVIGTMTCISAKMNLKDRMYAMRKLAPNFLRHRYSDESLHESAELRMRLKHDSIDIVHAFLDLDNEFHIVTEWYPEGSLQELLAFGHANFSNELKTNFALQIAEGLAYLHSRNTPIIHTNLAARNCYLTYEKEVGSKERVPKIKITDFWPFKLNVYSRENLTGCRNYRWFAPETLLDGVFDCKTDVWSYGVTIWEIFNEGQIPYGIPFPGDLYAILQKNRRLNTDYVSAEMSLILHQCWFWNPDMRPEAKSIIDQLAKNE